MGAHAVFAALTAIVAEKTVVNYAITVSYNNTRHFISALVAMKVY